MPVVVDPDPMVVESLLAAMPAGSHGVESVDRLNAWLGSHADEYVVVLGPTLTDEESVTTCEALRTAAPAISTILARETLDGDLLAYAMKAGARDVVHYSDTVSMTEAIGRAYQLFVALRGPAGAMHMSKVISVFSPKGGVGKTTLSVNLALALDREGCAPGLPGRPRPGLRRRRDHHAAVPDALDRAGDRVRGLDGRRDAGRPAHPAPGLPDGPRGTAAPGHPRAGLAPAGVPDHPHPARDLRLRRHRHGAGLRRAGADRAGRDRRGRPRGHPRRADAEEREGGRRDLRRTAHRQGQPAPGAQPRRRRGRHQRRQGRGDPRHGRRHADRELRSTSPPRPTRAARSSSATPSTSSAWPCASWPPGSPARWSGVPAPTAASTTTQTPQVEAEAKGRLRRRSKS